MSNVAYQPPPGNLLTRNPQLPPMPAAAEGAPGDSEYLAQEAMLRAEISRAHNDILQQLGYMDDNNQFVPGEVEIQAERQATEANRLAELARRGVTEEHQQRGTLFSGLRARDQALAEHPYVQALADLAVDVPKQLSQLFEKGSDLTSQYVRNRNQLLIDAARRKAALLASAPAAVDALPSPPELAPTPPPMVTPTPTPTPMTNQIWENPLIWKGNAGFTSRI